MKQRVYVYTCDVLIINDDTGPKCTLLSSVLAIWTDGIHMGIVKDIIHLDSTRWDQDPFDKEQTQWILALQCGQETSRHRVDKRRNCEANPTLQVNITSFGQCSWVQLGNNVADMQNTQHSVYDNNLIHVIWRWWSGNGIGLGERRHQDTSCTDESQHGWHPTRLRA
jgi:hypothetical protein